MCLLVSQSTTQSSVNVLFCTKCVVLEPNLMWGLNGLDPQDPQDFS